MKKLVLIAALGFSVLGFAQKDEMKTLKKIYDKDEISTEQLEDYKMAITSLSSMNLEEDDKVYFEYFKSLVPLADLKLKGKVSTAVDMMAVLNRENLSILGASFKAVLDYEKKTGKEKYTADIKDIKDKFLPDMKASAFDLNGKKQFKAASELFYSMYLFDKEDFASLENSAITAVQAEDMVFAEARYKDLLDSGYTAEGTSYYAINIASGSEESFNSAAQRSMFIAAKTHNTPRDEKKASKRPEFARMYAIILNQNKKVDLAIDAYKLAIELNPDDSEMRINYAALYYGKGEMETYKKILEDAIKIDPNNPKIYFNIGYSSLNGEQALVDEINKNISNKKKYDELVAQRNDLYVKVLPYFEKAHELDPTDANTISILKYAYKVLKMDDKAAKL